MQSKIIDQILEKIDELETILNNLKDLDVLKLDIETNLKIRVEDLKLLITKSQEYDLVERYLCLFFSTHKVVDDEIFLHASKNIQNGVSNIVYKSMIENGANINKIIDGFLPLNEILYNMKEDSSVELLKYMIQNGAKMDIFDEFDDCPLYWAIESQNIEAINLVIEAGANLFNEDYDIIYHALGFENEKLLKTVLNHIPNLDINVNGTKLIKIIFRDFKSNDLINLCLDKGAKIEDICGKRLFNIIVKYLKL